MTESSAIRPRRIRRRGLLALGVIAGVIAALYLSAWVIGPEVETIYFSPEEFAYKRTSYRLVPFLRFRATPTSEEEYRTPFMDYLHAEGLVPPPDGDRVRWDLCGEREFPGPILLYTGAAFEFSVVEAYPTRIRRWSETNPQHARILWPMVAELVRSDHYLSYWAADRQVHWSVLEQSLPLDEYGQRLESRRRAFTSSYWSSFPRKKAE